MNSEHYDHQKVERLRKAKGLSRLNLAKAIKSRSKTKTGTVSEMTIWRVEHGDAASYELLAQIAQHLEVPVTELLYSAAPARQELSA